MHDGRCGGRRIGAARLRRLTAAVAFGVYGVCCGAHGQEAAARYIDVLQNQGFAEIAVDYLQLLQEQNRLPESLQEDFDYVYGKALILAASESVAERERKLLDEALARLQKYRTERPTTDEAIDARGQIATIYISRAQRLLGAAQSTDKKAEAAERRKEARQLLEMARPELVQTIEQYAAALADAKKGGERPGRRRPGRGDRATELEASKLEVELNRGMVEYLLGQTFDREDEAEKAKSDEQLKIALKLFDDLFQRYRATGSLISSYALLWEGRVYQELGNFKTAEDIYKEVLSREPEHTNQMNGFEFDLYSQARLFWCQVQNLSGKPDQLLDHRYYSATDWINRNQRHRRERVGLGIQLEAAKAYIALAEKQEDGKERRRLFREAMKLLNDNVCRYPSEYLLEGFALRRKHAHEVRGASDEMSTFAEASTSGDESLGSEDWPAAVTAYEKALSLVKRDTPPDMQAAVKYRLAYAYSKSGDAQKCAQVADELARQQPPAKSSADAGGLALAAYWKLYAQAAEGDEKQRLGEKLLSLADYVEARFPTVAQADYARYLKGFMYASMRKFAESAAAYGAITPKANNYAEGQLRSGQMYWIAHQVAMRDGAASGADLVEKADAALVAAVAAYDELEKKTGERPIGWVEANLKRAEIALKTDRGRESMALSEPLVEMVRRRKPEGIEKHAVDVLVVALESAIATGSLDRVDQIVDVVLASDAQPAGGAGGGAITGVLVRLGGSFREKIAALESSGRAADAATTRGEFERFLDKISTRSAQNFTSIRFIGESYFALGDKKKAAEVFARALELVEKDPNAVSEEARDKTILSLRLRRLGALRDAGEFEEASKIVEALLSEHVQAGGKTYPLAYEMEKAHLLNAWAEHDASKHQASLDQWNSIANKLRPMKPARKEYFEARYGIAEAFRRMKNEKRAIQTLRSTMALSPECGGPEIRRKFEALLGELEAASTAQGG